MSVCDSVSVLWWLGCFSRIHTFLSMSPHTGMEASMELERGFTTISMAMDHWNHS